MQKFTILKQKLFILKIQWQIKVLSFERKTKKRKNRRFPIMGISGSCSETIHTTTQPLGCNHQAIKATADPARQSENRRESAWTYHRG